MNDLPTRPCQSCFQTLSVDEFHQRFRKGGTKKGYHEICKACQKRFADFRNVSENTRLPSITDSFGSWLSGLIDGEGSFSITYRPAETGVNRDYYSCRFSLNLRADDWKTLRMIKEETNLGILHAHHKNYIGNPQVVWTISALRDCFLLCELLDKYPLRSKKIRDYETWKQAVHLWVNHKRGASWEALKPLKERMEEGRKFPTEMDEEIRSLFIRSNESSTLPPSAEYRGQ